MITHFEMETGIDNGFANCVTIICPCFHYFVITKVID